MTQPRPIAVSDQGQGPYLQRFGRTERTIHALVIISFLGLVATGIPLRFSYAPWAATLMRSLGGPGSAGFIHRVCAVITFGYFFIHLAAVTRNLIRAEDKKTIFWGPGSMVPQPKDIRDVVGMFKWFLGRGPHPKFDRYSYMEKFDYWAVFWGVAIIGGSGLLLWVPTFFARFLPGWVFNVATIVHGDEALLALGFIFTIHFFNVHLRPEKFPIDLVIFTGRAREEYFEEEHPLEYERNKREGRLDQLRAPAPSRATYLWSVGLGFAALTVGIVLVALVIYALVS
jgi:cytochrome b subunit of formate dehydrogenase